MLRRRCYHVWCKIWCGDEIECKEEANDSESPGIRILCPTRWIVRAEALKSILDNFNVRLESLERVKDTELNARIQGVATQMMKFDYFFDVSLGLLILRHTDNVSRMLQKADMSTVEGQVITAMTVSTLRSSCNDASFDLFWQEITASAENLQIYHPVLPRRRKAPRRFYDPTVPPSCDGGILLSRDLF